MLDAGKKRGDPTRCVFRVHKRLFLSTASCHRGQWEQASPAFLLTIHKMSMPRQELPSNRRDFCLRLNLFGSLVFDGRAGFAQDISIIRVRRGGRWLAGTSSAGIEGLVGGAPVVSFLSVGARTCLSPPAFLSK